VAHRNYHGAEEAGDATTKQAAQERDAVEVGGAIRAFSGRHINVTAAFATVLAVLLGVAKWT
jgi:hypothetical protein